MIPLFSPHQTHAIDQLAQKQLGDDGWELMNLAAQQAWSVAERLWPEFKRCYILVGPGKNGGDGYLFAQWAHQAGWQVTLCQITPPKARLSQRAAKQVIEQGIKIESFSAQALLEADLVVDALFGIGLNRPLGKPWNLITQAVNLAEKPVLALDCPSGLDCSTGQAHPDTITASHTAAFICHKIGYYQLDGRDVCGQVHLCDLNLDPSLVSTFQPEAITPDIDDFNLPKRRHNSHKGSYGTALLIGGDYGMMGAIALASQACLRAGAGLVKVISRPEHQIPLTQMQPELMVSHDTALTQQLADASVIAIGPGLGQSDWAWRLFEQACQTQKSLIIDADALNCLAQRPFHYHKWVLTPHPKEAARLLKQSVTQVQQDRIAAVKALQKRYGGVIVLKGSGSLIYDGQDLLLCHYGNGGMAKGGMGDILTGLITGLVAQGISLSLAAQMGVTLHAYTADQLAKRDSESHYLPSDLLQHWLI
ncbi:bifunctional ADP-dependent NAD(P)H-hydrate dehydratase/NAD(P)H-hydrate epimerase [Thiomicrospira cyclica]|uniref:Bifunctional NAD(P)H-hydrate repair enzyme n=1 Tax=Thiomicrospira cyclica (strain DSM 14477 / JCM 11371 / ALM1) TaxID=717773 RepID=F6DAD9_THICA|nr:bifunctional ADP-dependent NAD(P)H-hydrate dehydratase/NAD(P)H-hydrate epimerase [Thiomicrospira cyclica]AEG31105.1 YjeF-related protein [Thiomicrospira cyclica ALM1]